MTIRPSSSVPATGSYRSMGDAVTLLTRAFQLERGLLRMLGGWMPGVPYWDAKLAMGDHLWAHAQYGSRLLKRLHELKENTAERQECQAVDELLRGLGAAPDGTDFLCGFYGTAMSRLSGIYTAWAAQIDPVMDPFSGAILVEATNELRGQAEWYAAYQPAYSPGALVRNKAWSDRLAGLFDAIDLPAGQWRSDRPAPAIEEAFTCVPTPQRDASFQTARVNEINRRTDDSFEGKRLAIFYNHTQEMQFAESLGAILYETPEMPWAFHYDMARHCVDEIRHTRMGCTRFEQLGQKLHDFPMLLQNYSLRAKLDPMERFCMMTLVIEASSFEKKRAGVKMFQEKGDEISARYESYDIRDEMQHVNFGHTWVPIMLRVAQDARSVTELVQYCQDILADALKNERKGVSGY